MIFLLIFVGFVLLILGGDVLVRGAVGAAKRLKISSVMIGLTLVGFGTSTPELVTSVRAAMLGSPGISVGNVAGSNIANILLVLGCAALISPLNTERKLYIRDSLALIISTALFIVLAFYGEADRIWGIFFLILLGAYILYAYIGENKTPGAVFVPAEGMPLFYYIILAVAGIMMTIAGADMLVKGAVAAARTLGVSETVIGLTVVAVGTSLPELAASVIASLRRQNAIALGNIIGSNIYNILFILGLTGIISPVKIPSEILKGDAWVMAASALLLVAFTITGRIISRATGAGFLLLYALYIFYLVR